MTETPDVHTVSDAGELMRRLTAVHSRVFHLRCTRTEDEEVDASDIEPANVVVTPSIQMRGSQEFQELRLRIRVQRPDVDVEAEVGFQFTWDEPVSYEDPAQLAIEFADDFALKYAVDYMRPLLDGLARSVDVPQIGLLHDVASRWKIAVEDEPAEAEGRDHR